MPGETFNPGLILPEWAKRYAAEKKDTAFTCNERMNIAIELSRLNVRHGTGGPFGAAVFDRSTGLLVSAGINLVVRNNCSHAHAEMVALAIAEHALSSYTLYRPDGQGFELVTSCEPCAMCFGAIIWSGVNRLVCGASTADACMAGFDEGPKTERWIQELERRGIEVATGVLRPEACGVLEEYTKTGGTLYNAR
jgi:tRNA(Arg) A34 adenosine deaminase TadA